MDLSETAMNTFLPGG